MKLPLGTKSLVALTLLAVALSSCTSAVSSLSSTVSSAITALLSIQSSSSMLPKSLKSSSTGKAVVDVVASSQDGIQSKGYGQLQKDLSENVVGGVMALMQSAFANNTSPTLETVYSLGKGTINNEQAAILGVPNQIDAGKAIIHQLDDTGNSVDIKWHMSGSGNFRIPKNTAPPQAGTYDYYVHLVLSNALTPATMKAKLAFYGTQTLASSFNDTTNNIQYAAGHVFKYGFQGSFDSETGSNTVLYGPKTNADGTITYDQGRYESVTKSGSNVSFLSSDGPHFNVAYGNDTSGGVLSKGAFASDGSYQFNEEFYNASGELIGMTRGEENANFPWLAGVSAKFNNLHGSDFGTALSSAPGADAILKVKVTESWSGTTRTLTSAKLSTDGGTTYGNDVKASMLAFNGSTVPAPWMLIYKANTAINDTTWAAGDALYYNTKREVSGSDTIFTYQRGFVYPARVVHYGDPVNGFYQSYSFPLKFLTLNSDLVSAGYTIKENNTSPEQFWLQKTSSVHTGFDPSTGDLDVTNVLRVMDFSHWDPATQAVVTKYGIVATSTELCPPGFAVASTTTDAMSGVHAQLETLANTAKDTIVTATALSGLATGLGVAPIVEADLSGYPQI